MHPAFRPSDPDFLADPYPAYARLREEAPVFYYEPWGKWIFTRYHDINALLRDKRLGRVIQDEASAASPQTSEHPAFASIQKGSLLEIEPPEHTRIRAVVHEVFTPRHVRELSTRVEALCESLVDGLLAREKREVDLIRDFAEPLPVTVIAELLGVPQADRALLLPWSKAIIGMFEPERTPAMEQAAEVAAAEFADCVKGLMELKRREPGNDLISRMVEARAQDPASISEGEIVANCILFLNAGHEAVVNVIGNGMLALLKHPEQLELLRREPEHIGGAIEEMMRFDTPLQFFERFVLEDLEAAGQRFKRGDKLCLYYASANHDPEVFENPECFDVRRHPNPHIAFGLGIHYCIGAPLARLELLSAIRSLLGRLPELRLVTSEPVYHPKNVFRYLEELRVAY